MSETRPGALIVGLTGGIGSGKSAVAAMLGERGAAVVDADAVAHELTAPGGTAMAAIGAAFGPGVIAADGALDRAAMRQLAFEQPAVRKRLEGILHPAIRAECDARARAAIAAGAPYVVLMVPLLIESNNYRERVARVAVVDCPEEVQIARVMARNDMPRAEVERIMATQATRAQRLAAADDVIDNGGTLAQLTPQLEALHSRYMEMGRAG